MHTKNPFFYRCITSLLFCLSFVSKTWALDLSEDQVGINKSVPENTIQVHQFDAGLDETYYISGGVDQDLFQLGRSDGKLSFKKPPNFEDPIDSDNDNKYVIEITTEDDFSSSSEEFSIEVTDVQETPKFVESSYIIVENQTATLQTGAIDEDGDPLVHKLLGEDAQFFEIDESLGSLTLTNPADYEKPIDTNKDGTYEVTIVATDGSNQISQDITVKIDDVNEPYNEFKLSSSTYSTTLKAGVVFSKVIITDPDKGASYQFVQLEKENSPLDLASDGSISVNQKLTEEKPDFIQLKVKATDEHGLVFENSFLISKINIFESDDLGEDSKITFEAKERPIVPAPIDQIDGGESHSVFLDLDGWLWGFGSNSYGQLGQGNDSSRTFFEDPVLIDGPGITQAVCGRYHTLYIKDQKVWGMGFNKFNQVDASSSLMIVTPKLIFPTGKEIGSPNVHYIACGNFHSAMIYGDERRLRTWGLNVSGQLGEQSINKNNVLSVWMHEDKTFFTARGDGGVFAFSASDYPQKVYQGSLVDGDLSFTGSKGFASTAIYNPQVAGYKSDQVLTKLPIHFIKSFHKYATGIRSTFGFYHDNPLGINVSDFTEYGRLGRVEPLKYKNLIDLSVGTRHALALFNDGSLWGSGTSFYGQLGIGPNSPIHINDTTYGLKRTIQYNDIYPSLLDNSGKLGWIWIKLDDDVKMMKAGNFHSLWVKNNGTLHKLGAKVISQNKRTFLDARLSDKIWEYSQIAYTNEGEDGLFKPYSEGESSNLKKQFKQHNTTFKHDHVKRKIATGVVSLKVWGLHDDDDDDLELEENTFEVSAENIYSSVGPQEIFSIVVEHHPEESLNFKIAATEEEISKHVISNGYLRSILKHKVDKIDENKSLVRFQFKERIEEPHEWPFEVKITAKYEKSYRESISYRVKIRVIAQDAYNKVPRFSTPFNIPAWENSSNVDYIRAVSGRDIYVTYRFSELTTEQSKFFDNEDFTLSSGGSLSFKKSKDFERDKRNYYIKVDSTAYGSFRNGIFATGIFRVVLQDRYEPKPPAFLNLPTQHSVDEGETFVSKIEAKVEDENREITFLLGDDKDSSFFELTEPTTDNSVSSQILRFKSAPDFESGKTRYLPTIKAFYGLGSAKSEMVVKQLVVSVNDVEETVPHKWSEFDSHASFLESETPQILIKNSHIENIKLEDLEFTLDSSYTAGSLFRITEVGSFIIIKPKYGIKISYDEGSSNNYEIRVIAKSKLDGTTAEKDFEIEIKPDPKLTVGFHNQLHENGGKIIAPYTMKVDSENKFFDRDLENDQTITIYQMEEVELPFPYTSVQSSNFTFDGNNLAKFLLTTNVPGDASFTISGPDAQFAKLIQRDGASERQHIYFDGILSFDYENPSDSDKNNRYDFSIKITPNESNIPAKTIHFNIVILNNENEKVWGPSDIKFLSPTRIITEETKLPLVANLEATTEDNDHQKITYSLVSNPDEIFSITEDGKLLLEKSLRSNLLRVIKVRITAHKTEQVTEKMERVYKKDKDVILIISPPKEPSRKIQFYINDKPMSTVTHRVKEYDTNPWELGIHAKVSYLNGVEGVNANNDNSINYKFTSNVPTEKWEETFYILDRTGGNTANGKVFLSNKTKDRESIQTFTITATLNSDDTVYNKIILLWIPQSNDEMEQVLSVDDAVHTDEIIEAQFDLKSLDGVDSEELSPIFETQETLHTYENNNFVSLIEAKDYDDLAVKLELISEFEDGDKFELTDEGFLLFKSLPNYEHPDGYNGNSYLIRIRSEGSRATTTKKFWIVVHNDEDEIIFSDQSFVTEENNESFEIRLSANHISGERLIYSFPYAPPKERVQIL